MTNEEIIEKIRTTLAEEFEIDVEPVSYTHLDVYKRQGLRFMA